MNRTVGSVLTLMNLLFSGGPVAAQTYTQMQWGMNKGVTPYQFGANINGVWSNLGTVNSTGAWSLSITDFSTTGYVSITPPSPAWSTYTTPQNPVLVNVNNLPATAMPQGIGGPGQYTSIGMISAFTAAVDTPSTDTARAQPGNVPGFINIGASGVSRTASPIKGAVGVFGGGMVNVDAGEAWGGNFVGTNFPYMSGQAPGFNSFKTVGAEIDVYLNAPVSGPFNGSGTGLLIYGAVPSIPSGGLYGIVVENASRTPGVGWSCALCVADAPNTVGLNLGAAAVNTGSTTIDSQFIRLASLSAGVKRFANIWEDSAGVVRIKGGATGAGLEVQDGSNVTALTVNQTGATITGVLTLPSVSSEVKLGSDGGANTPNVNFKSSGNANNFDSRIVASGGSASPGSGQLSFDASAGAVFTGPLKLPTYTIAGLPACDATRLNSVATVSNGTDYATGVYGGAVSATGAVTRKVFCTNTGGPTTYAWAYN